MMDARQTSSPVETKVEPGEFPFPLTDGPEESRYLTWLRNHSNYMVERGLVDYLRSIAVLVRGIVINFLIFVPPLLVVALVLGFFHDLMYEHPFFLTRTALIAAVIWILLFLLIVPLFKIVRYKTSLATGSDSSVKLRDRYERSFGGFLLVILVAAAAESLPHLVDFFHQFRTEGLIWQEIFSLATALAVLSGANKLLSALGGATKKVAMLLIGILGLLVPLLGILYVTEFLLYGRMPGRIAFLIPMLVPAVGVVFILIAIAVGLWQRAFKRSEALQLLGLIFLGLVMLVVVFGLLGFAEIQFEELKSPGKQFASELTKLASGFEKLQDDKSEGLKKVLDDLNEQEKTLFGETRDDRDDFPEKYERYVEQVEVLFRQFDKELRNLSPAERDRLRENLDNLAQVELAYRIELRELKKLANATLDNTNLRELDELTVEQLAAWKPEQRAQLSNWFVNVATRFLQLDPQDQAQLPEHFEQTAIAVVDVDPLDAQQMTKMAPKFAELREKLVVLPAGLLQKLAELPELEASEKPAEVLYGELADLVPGEGRHELAKLGYKPKALLVFVYAFVIWLACWLTVDVNLTSIHGLYRDRLASAYLVGEDTTGDIDIEADIDLEDICSYEARSTAPYHLVNVALNLQGSNDIGVRDRNSDFFIFSKRFIGGPRTGYCRSRTMEQVYPQIDLAAAMAISAAAASPNMGRETNPALVAFMTMLNVRLGYWIPNPGLLEEVLAGRGRKQKTKRGKPAKPSPGFTFAEVFEKELDEIEQRRKQAYGSDWDQTRPLDQSSTPTTGHGLVGIGFSGGGIRSATLNLGIAQVLHKHGVFDHLDYMSTVSGGGYLGSSISTLMRCKTKQSSEIAGTVSVETTENGDQVVHVSGDELEEREYRFWITDELLVKEGDAVKASDSLTGSRSEIEGVVSLESTNTEQIVCVSQVRKYSIPKDYKLGNQVEQGDTVSAHDVLAMGSGPTITSEIAGKVQVAKTRTGSRIVVVTDVREHRCSLDAEVVVEIGDRVNKGDVLLKHPCRSEIAGAVSVETKDCGEQIVRVKGPKIRKYRFSSDAELRVKNGDRVIPGERLIRRPGPRLRSQIEGIVKAETAETGKKVVTVKHAEHARYEYSRYDALQVKTGDWVNPGDWLVHRWNSLGERFNWRVRPTAFLREMRGKLDEKHYWVNLSDGGHIENLATIELLRRRCELIIVGDGEADPKHHFKGLATLVRTASIDLGIQIEIDLEELRLRESKDQDASEEGLVCDKHWAIGKITYPEKDKDGKHDVGYLLYLKSSFTGREGEVVQEYRRRNPRFPHQTTADQFFDEGQFEAYRSLGQHIAEQALEDCSADTMFSELPKWFTSLVKASTEDYGKMTVAKLKTRLREKSLPLGGTKSELIARLKATEAAATSSPAKSGK